MDGFEASRVTALILNAFDSAASSRIAVITDPPWLPEAPNTVMIFDIAAITTVGCV
jgi:hypothetical protein